MFYCRPPRDYQAAMDLRTVAPSSAVGSGFSREIAIVDAGGIQFAGDFHPDRSLLSFATPLHPELWFLKEQYEKIRLYRDWFFGPNAPLRCPRARTTAPTIWLRPAPTCRSCCRTFRGRPGGGSSRRWASCLEGIVDISCPVTGGTVSLFLEERDGRQIPASRLSDGTSLSRSACGPPASGPAAAHRHRRAGSGPSPRRRGHGGGTPGGRVGAHPDRGHYSLQDAGRRTFGPPRERCGLRRGERRVPIRATGRRQTATVARRLQSGRAVGLGRAWR